MSGVRFTTLLLLIIGMNNLEAQWPENLSQYQSSLCLVEFYQPQYETREIKDEARIKRTITGILVDGSGLVLTSDLILPANLDIVASNPFFSSIMPPEDITVSFVRDKKLKAKLIGKDEERRIAFVQILEGEDLPDAINFIGRAEFKIGEPIFLMQHLNGSWEHEVIFSQNNINAVIEKPEEKLLTTAGIRALSPGGLVVDAMGNPIGITYRGDNPLPVFDFEMDEPSNGINVIEILPARNFIELIKTPPKLIAHKSGSGKSWLGIQMQILTSDMAEYWNLSDTYGILVNSIVPGSPAEEARLQIGDIITKIENLKIPNDDRRNLDVFRNYVRSLPEGAVELDLIRDHIPMTLGVNLKSAPMSQFLAEEFRSEQLGLSVKELTQDIILNNNLEFDIDGVWVSRVEEAGASSLGGLYVDDIILAINDKKIANLEQFKKTVEEINLTKAKYIQIFVQREGKTQFVFINTDYE